MPAGALILYIEQGATFSRTLTWRDSNQAPIPITGYIKDSAATPAGTPSSTPRSSASSCSS